MSAFNLTSDILPTMKQLLILKSGKKIDMCILATDWKILGIFFEFDKDGKALKLIEECGKTDPVACY